MEHTEYYQLSLWDADDRIMREDFNDNNEKIDATLKAHDTAIGTKANAATVGALTTRVGNLESGKADAATALTMDNPPYVFGRYTSSTTEDVTVTLGFRPKCILVTGQNTSYSASGSCWNFAMVTPNNMTGLFTITETGFVVRAMNNEIYPYVGGGRSCQYMAFK